MSSLERRIMLHADPNDPTHVDELPDDLGVFPVIITDLNNAGTTAGGTSTGVAGSLPLSAVPRC